MSMSRDKLEGAVTGCRELVKRIPEEDVGQTAVVVALADQRDQLMALLAAYVSQGMWANVDAVAAETIARITGKPGDPESEDWMRISAEIHEINSLTKDEAKNRLDELTPIEGDKCSAARALPWGHCIYVGEPPRLCREHKCRMLALIAGVDRSPEQ